MTTPSHSRTATFWRVFLTVFVLGFTVAAAIMFLVPEKYASTCRVRVEKEDDGISTLTGNALCIGWRYDPDFVKSTFEIIHSPAVLTNVIAKLNLNVRWGERYNGGGTWPTWESLAMLQHNLELGVVRGTKLINITCYSVDKYEAAEIANAVAEAYGDYEMNVRKKTTLAGLNTLLDDAAANAARIEAVTTNVNYLRGKLKIRDDDPTGRNFGPALTLDVLRPYSSLLK